MVWRVWGTEEPAVGSAGGMKWGRGVVVGSLWGTQGCRGVVKGEVGGVRGSVGAQRVMRWDVGS